jgi:hypothetical protein
MLLGSDVDYEPICTPFNTIHYKFYIYNSDTVITFPHSILSLSTTLLG